jgi:hypothetical protein
MGWSDAGINHRLSYQELWREDEELKARNNNKTRVELECEKVTAIEL